MTKWKCEACGKVHGGNVRQCRNCGHTVLSPYRGEEEPESFLSRWVRTLKEWVFGSG